MKLHHSMIQRLALTKYVFTKAVEQSNQPEPLSGMSVLMFHDAVEIFLQICSEHLNTGKKQINFMEYWNLLDNCLEHNLPQKEAMRRLNTSRVGLKHTGTLPSRLDIETFRVSTAMFFEEATTLVFGLDFDSISLIEYVDPSESRELLNNAEKQLEESKLHDALQSVAVAFEKMLVDYEKRKSFFHRRSPFTPREELQSMRSIHVGRANYELAGLNNFAEKVTETMSTLQNIVRILALGLDYKKYSRFEIFIPTFFRTGDGKCHFQFSDNLFGVPKATKEDVRFCIDYVIESAIKLKEFDYSVNI